MPITQQDAIDEIFGSVKQVFDASTSFIGYIPELRWPGNPVGNKPDDSKIWGRASQQIVTDDQASLSSANGKTLYEAVGLLYVQIFTPRNKPESPALGLQLALKLRDKFQAQSNSAEVWFRKAIARELPEVAKNYRINFVVEFRYKTLKTAA